MDYYDHMPNRWEAEVRLSLWAPYFVLMSIEMGVDKEKAKGVVKALSALVSRRKIGYPQLIYQGLEGRLCVEIPGLLDKDIDKALRAAANYLLTGRELIDIPDHVRVQCIDSAKKFFDQYMRLINKQSPRIVGTQPEKVVEQY